MTPPPQPRTAADILPADASRTRRPPHRAHARPDRGRSTPRWNTPPPPMVTTLFDQAEARDPQHQRRWIVLVDGANHQLDCLQREAQRRGVHIDIIVDFIHVLEYLWKAAEDLHPAHAGPRRLRPDHAARDLLEGHAPRVIADLRAHLRTRTEPDNTPRPGTRHRLPHRQTALPQLPHRADPGLADRHRRHRRLPAATWSKTASTSPAPAGACPAPKPSSSSAPSSPTATSSSTGVSTSTRTTNAPTPAATRTNSPWPHDR